MGCAHGSFLGYRESVEWAREARPVVDELEQAVKSSPSRDLVALLERAFGHVVKVIQTCADDSSAMVGDLARDLLKLHARACEAGVADPVKLANWMIRVRFVDQDFFEPDPVRYRDALGEKGLSAYRAAVEAHSDQDAFAVRHARERLAILDCGSERIVELLGGDLSTAHQCLAVAEAMVELDLPEDALAWATRGIEETRGPSVRPRMFDPRGRGPARRRARGPPRPARGVTDRRQLPPAPPRR